MMDEEKRTLEEPLQNLMGKPWTEWNLPEPTPKQLRRKEKLLAKYANTICPCDLSQPSKLAPKFDKSYSSLRVTKPFSVCKCLSCNTVMVHRAVIKHCFVDVNQRLVCQKTLKPADGGTDEVPPPFYRIKATWPSARVLDSTSVRFVLDTRAKPIYPPPDGLPPIPPRMSFQPILLEKKKGVKREPLSTPPATKRKSAQKRKQQKKPRSIKQPRKIIPMKDREYDPDLHCGVILKDFYEDRCKRTLSCSVHSIALRRKVPNRSLSFNELLRQQKIQRAQEQQEYEAKEKAISESCEPQPGPSSACFHQPPEESPKASTSSESTTTKVTKGPNRFLNLVFKRNSSMFMTTTSCSGQSTSAQGQAANIFSKWDLSKRNFSESSFLVDAHKEEEDNTDDVIITHDKPYLSILKQRLERSAPVPPENEKASTLPPSQTEGDKNIDGAT